MNWKKILKIERYESAVAEEFAPEDIQEGKDEAKRLKEIKDNENIKRLKPTILIMTERYKNETNPRLEKQWLHSIRSIFYDNPLAPRLTSSKEINIDRIYEFMGE